MRKLYRSASDRWFTGLCGGLADYLGISATLVRILTVIAAFCSFGTTVLLYFIASLLIPKRYDHIQFM
ncbi:PspC domain-containing protein [Paenibacillus filicis]|uniref:PspC domain-containing protein n=1 Tax=Paenibacillus gyeongsangnamensis TaxID=3388067 RepID=A0ABT4QAV8_9BACL|nr:PspC domain-containing protein [Paenibacillus filicis]MCZ8513976.1 PspC domain-containing protein [Paenibacillus filicis]